MDEEVEDNIKGIIKGIILQNMLLSPNQVSEMTGLSLSFLAQARARGKGFVPVIKIGKSCKYRLSDIQDYCNSQILGSGI